MSTATAVRERPISFMYEMVRALKRGDKTKTRRVVKAPPFAGPLPGGKYGPSEPFVGADGIWRFMRGVVSYEADDIGPCPYGQPGDRLWVREATIQHRSIGQLVGYVADGCEATEHWEKFVSERFMPRRYSRFLLEITDVRVERVQEITEADILAEGYPSKPSIESLTEAGMKMLPPRRWFERLWAEINERRGYGWDINPWVWVVSFRRVES